MVTLCRNYTKTVHCALVARHAPTQRWVNDTTHGAGPGPRRLTVLLLVWAPRCSEWCVSSLAVFLTMLLVSLGDGDPQDLAEAAGQDAEAEV